MIREESFILRRPNGLAIRGETFMVQGATGGTVVICHGFKGFAHWGFFPHLARAIASAGMRAITFDFSGSGVGEDRENFSHPEAFANNTFSEELDDLKDVVRDARQRGWIAGGYGLLGHSRGGGVSVLHAAANPDVKALVTWAAISHVLRWTPADVITWKERGYVDIVNARTGQVLKLGTPVLSDVEKHAANTLNIPAAATRIEAPWLILHGSDDETVPLEEAEKLHSLAPASTLRVLHAGNHGFGAKHPFEDESETLQTAMRETISFFGQHLT